ncbi:MAG: phosphopantothenoylcysteine decarboxylase / phosphopantothenate--cysteine ligase, partial [Elusimicrobia bacterium]
MARARKARRVALGVSGSIAAYKACTVVRLLVKAGCEVRVAMTANAAKFVSPLTLSALARGPVVLDLMDPAHWDMAHLSLASWA